MRTEIDHRALEARVAHHGHRDQELAVKVATPGRIIADAGSFAANVVRSFAFRVHPQALVLLRHILILGCGSVNQASRLKASGPDALTLLQLAAKPATITSNSIVCRHDNR